MLVCALFSSQCATCLVNVCESSHLSMFLYMVCSLCPCSRLIEHGCAACWLRHGSAQSQSNISKFFNWPAQPQLLLPFLVVWPHLLKTSFFGMQSADLTPLLGVLIGSQVSEEKKSHRAKRVAFLQDEGAQPLNLSSKPKASESKSPTSPASPQVPTLKLGPGSLKHSAHSSIGGPPSRLSSIGTRTSTVSCNSINT